MVEQTARCGHHDIAVPLQIVPLLSVAHTAVDEGDLCVHEAHVVAEGCFHLHGQLARWLEDQAADAWFGMVEFGKHRQCEGGCLARACLRRGDEVSAGKNHWNGAELDGRGIRVTHALRSV